METSIEVSFWDGETFAFKNSLPEEKINWWYLTNDGTKCFYSIGPIKRLLLGMVKYLDDNGGPLKVWDINSGRLDETFDASEAGVRRNIRAIGVSPDEAFITFVARPPKTKESARRQVVLGIAKRNHASYELQPRYEIKPDPHIWEWGVAFSPDGQYFALLAKKNLQIYETSTGEKKYELAGAKRVPTYWLADNKVLLFDDTTSMEAIDITSGKSLYKQPLIFESSSGDDFYYVYDSTVIKPHPRRNLLLTVSNQYVKIIDSITGELLQTVVAPPMDYTKKKPRLSNKPLVLKGDWSADGRSLFTISHDRKSISLWRFEN
jgi:hypothetical protein